MQSILQSIQTKLSTITDLGDVRLDVPESINTLPTTVIYPVSGSCEFRSGYITRFHEIEILSLLSRSSLPTAIAQAVEIQEQVPQALLELMQSGSIETINNTTYRCGAMQWGNDLFFTIAFRILVKEM